MYIPRPSVYIIVKNFSFYIRYLIFICKFFKSLKIMKFIMRYPLEGTSAVSTNCAENYL